ncbi:hypothetical protein N865_20440 [Intrasporangium oryzae NRRL B-24470]|uniref:Uncharacterized protein n=1 Tax=Intrasporangium oryzae NRRL B-24470 TaxID=1386089 RepID=W9G7N4_9MICO|nr:hypothetical protein N865_20440 [Intrasporangium oryzae NRRL B-24470]
MTRRAYAARVNPEMRRLLTARFLTMVGWLVLLVAGFAVFSAVTSHIDSGPLRWIANVATLSGSITLGLLLQGRVLANVDPDGTLREQVARLGADSEDQADRAPAGQGASECISGAHERHGCRCDVPWSNP